MTPPPPPPDSDRSRRDVLRLLGVAAAGAAAGTVAPGLAGLPGAAAQTTTSPSPTAPLSPSTTAPRSADPPPGATIEHRAAPTGRRPTAGTTPAGTTTSGEQGLAPFVLLGFTVIGVGPKPEASFRAQAADGWTPWTALEFDHADTVSEPVWVGSATG